MNLIQIQDRLRGMPIQLLQQYANGSNPEVPPYIALGVLKQKEAEMQQHSNSQGAAQGQMPSVKSQLEQKVGAMQQQASMMPQGLAQGPAAPAPQGPVQAASGGLMSGNAGSTMKFAEGGIIGFSGTTGSYLGRSEGKNLLSDTTGYEGMGMLEAIQAMGGDATEFLKRKGRDAAQYIQDMEKNALQKANSHIIPNEMAPTGNVAGSRRTPQQLADAEINPVATSPDGGLATGATRVPPTGPRSPAAPPAAGGLGASSVASMLQKQLGKESVAPTPEGAAKSVQDINKQFGLDTPGGKEEREMIAQMRADRAAQTQDRGTQNLINYLINAKGSNLGDTFASGARSSMSEIEKQRADDMAHSQKLYEMVSGLNKSDRAEKVGSAGKAANLFGEETKAAADADRNKLTTLANIYHTDVAAAAQIKAQQIAAAARSGSMDDKQQLAELKALQASIQAQIKLTPFDKKVVGPLQDQLATINAQIAQMAGIGTMSAAPGAPKISAADQALIDKYQKK